MYAKRRQLGNPCTIEGRPRGYLELLANCQDSRCAHPHFRRHTIFAAALFACYSCSLHAQTAPQRIDVTGSAIKRIGATTINDLIKSIAVVDILDTGELQGNSPGSSGTARMRMRMRGLGDTQTLVLVNGRRVPNNPLQDASGAGSAFNINQLPLSVIERVEALKDGGSAIYGADGTSSSDCRRFVPDQQRADKLLAAKPDRSICC